jgi:serine phosphatase RsbU (regulator of sigma subunit)
MGGVLGALEWEVPRFGMNVKVAVSKLPKSGFTESGDTVEIVERPRGGLTVIMADGQTHGRAAKRVSMLVVTKAAQLVAEGVRDGAVARGVHDLLYAARDGKVSTELTMVSADIRSKTLVITRNSHVPVFLRRADGRVERLGDAVEPIGIREVMKPLIVEVPIEAGTVVLAFTDGVYGAGRRYGQELNLDQVEAILAGWSAHNVSGLAEMILDQALDLDHRRPADDMSVLALSLTEQAGDQEIRRMEVSAPF